MTDTTQKPTQKPSKVKSFFEHIGEWLKDHLGDAQSVEHTAATALAIFSPLLEQLIGLAVGPTVQAKVAAAVSAIQTKLANAQALLAGAETTVANGQPITLDSVLDSIKSDLSTLLADADVKDSEKAAEISSVVTTLIGEIEAIQEATEGHTAPVVGAPSATAAA